MAGQFEPRLLPYQQRRPYQDEDELFFARRFQEYQQDEEEDVSS